MALPIQAAPKYKTTLPVSKRDVEYRPFLVKEQKILLIAQETENQEQIVAAVKNLILSVTEGEVDPNDLTAVDMEWLFLKVRAVSIGESSKISVKCEQCDFSTPVELNLNDVVVEGEIAEDNRIMLNDFVGVRVNLPNMKVLEKISSLPQSEQLFGILKSSIEMIFDQDNVYYTNEIEPEDLDDFIDSLTFQQLSNLGEYFDNAPRLVTDINYTCGDCGKQNSKELTGLQNFF